MEANKKNTLRLTVVDVDTVYFRKKLYDYYHGAHGTGTLAIYYILLFSPWFPFDVLFFCGCFSFFVYSCFADSIDTIFFLLIYQNCISLFLLNSLVFLCVHFGLLKHPDLSLGSTWLLYSHSQTATDCWCSSLIYLKIFSSPFFLCPISDSVFGVWERVCVCAESEWKGEDENGLYWSFFLQNNMTPARTQQNNWRWHEHIKGTLGCIRRKKRYW